MNEMYSIRPKPRDKQADQWDMLLLGDPVPGANEDLESIATSRSESACTFRVMPRSGAANAAPDPYQRPVRCDSPPRGPSLGRPSLHPGAGGQRRCRQRAITCSSPLACR